MGSQQYRADASVSSRMLVDMRRAVIVRPLCAATDGNAWRAMRLELWPDSDAADADDWAAQPAAVTLVAEEPGSGELLGFAEVGTRGYADGCDTSPVAFLEGWFVRAAERGHGVGAQLVQGAAQWARQQGLTEMASDSLLDDTAAFAAHRRAGFQEVERSIKYRMVLDAEGAP